MLASCRYPGVLQVYGHPIYKTVAAAYTKLLQQVQNRQGHLNTHVSVKTPKDTGNDTAAVKFRSVPKGQVKFKLDLALLHMGVSFSIGPRFRTEKQTHIGICNPSNAVRVASRFNLAHRMVQILRSKLENILGFGILLSTFCFVVAWDPAADGVAPSKHTPRDL